MLTHFSRPPAATRSSPPPPSTGNLFLDGASNIKVGDFGLAKELGSGSQFATTSLGTPFYMSPEMISEAQYNEKSDIWVRARARAHARETAAVVGWAVTGCMLHDTGSAVSAASALHSPHCPNRPLALPIHVITRVSGAGLPHA